MTAPQQVQVESPGLVVMTTHGSVTVESAQSLLAMVRAMEREQGLEFDVRFIVGSLVDKARNDAVEMMLAKNYRWIWMIDADMQFNSDLYKHMLQAAYGLDVKFDIIGGYCNLRGEPYLPTIDTGTGTWESHDAGQGVLPVIRTGAACLLVKRHVFERMAYPWFGIRHPPRAIDALAEVDGYARQKFDGRNPLSDSKEWEQLTQCASEDAEAKPRADLRSSVGEDSNFCDAAKALGFQIAVNTSAVCGHLSRGLITPQKHMEVMKRGRKKQALLAGISED